jgi:putative NADPH-quinone reductase
MKVAIVFNHPYEGSFCNAILQSVIAGIQKAGNEADVLHLDNDQFNPVMSATDLKRFTQMKYNAQSEHYLQPSDDPQVLDYKKRLEAADHLVFIFPIWWELMPALTKGFIDRIIFPGIAYQYEKENKMVRRLPIKSVTVITTMNTPALLYRIIFRNAIRHALFTGTFWKLGYKNRKWISLNMVKFVSTEKRKKWLAQIEERFYRVGRP